jgi:hypothetical protein
MFTQLSRRDAVIESVVADPRTFQMGDDLNNGRNEELFGGCFDRVAEGVATIDRKVTVHFEVKFDKGFVPGVGRRPSRADSKTISVR